MVDKEGALQEFDLGDQALILKKLDEALVHFHKAIELDPGLVKAHNNIAVCYYD
jgi:tetratricopeptide (TPR) repeat protein